MMKIINFLLSIFFTNRLEFQVDEFKTTRLLYVYKILFKSDQ